MSRFISENVTSFSAKRAHSILLRLLRHPFQSLSNPLAAFRKKHGAGSIFPTLRVSIAAVSIDCYADLHIGDHLQQIVHMKRLREDGPVHGTDEICNLSVAAMTGHENETVAEMRAHPLDSAEEHVARQCGHHHIAKDDLEILGKDLVDPLDAVLHADDLKAVRLKKFIHDVLELRIILEKEHGALCFRNGRF